MVEKSQDIEMDKSVAVGNVENNSEKIRSWNGESIFIFQSFSKFVMFFLEFKNPTFYVKQKFKHEKKNHYSLFKPLG